MILRRHPCIPRPGWHGELPAGAEELRSSTNLVWIIGRTYCTGTPEDYTAVHAIQDQYKLMPLSAYGKPYTAPPGKVDPSIDMKTPPREQVERMDTISYFKLLAELMKQNPPYTEDAPILARLARIGLVPGQDFDSSKLASVPNVQNVPKLGVERIAARFPASERVMRVSFRINGDPVAVDVEPRLHLADCLREVLSLTGTHLGCEHGACGACTVIVDGAAVRACLMLTVQAEGASIVTVEGVSTDESLSPLQIAFRKHHALQCGFCTPGMLTTAHALLTDEPDADADRIRSALSGNLCRCTGYIPIIEAVLEARAAYRNADKP